MARVLIVDDEAAICWALRSVVEGEGHQATVTATAARALEAFRGEIPDAVFLDVRLPDGDGLDVLDAMRAESAGAAVVVITAHGGLETAVRAMQAGAADYLVKPLDVRAVRTVLARVLAGARAAAAAPPAAAPDAAAPSGSILVGRSAPMQEVYKRIGAVAGTDVPVLILGESGTGKELVARAIHAASERRLAPFEPIDCAALPAELAESELYGHERGAFTGAVRDREGRIRHADGGTLFLDEIGDLPLAVQAKLLRFLAERELVPVGGNARMRVDVRVVAATNRPLEKAVRDGTFREDLFYRLNVFAIHVPPLRERRADIPALVERFLGRAGRPRRLTEEALALLARHDWPGNVRELRNAVEYASVMARGGPVTPEHLPPYLQSREAPARDLPALAARLLDEALAAGLAPARTAAERVERALIEEALRRSCGSISGAARLLGLTRATVRSRVRNLGLAGGAAEEV